MNVNKKISLSKTNLDVLTVGELLIDFISEDYVTELKSAVHFHKTFGGSPGNIAVNLSGMGFKTAIIGSVGNDEFGEFIQDCLETQKVNIEGLQKVEKATSMIFITKSLESPHYFAVRNADYCLKDKKTNYQLIDQCKIFHFTAWALSMPQIRDVTMDLLQYARLQKKLITFDPNYRKNLWEIDHNGAEWIKEYVLPLVDIVKPSEDDAVNIWNVKGSMLENVFMDLSEKNEMTIIFTKGAKGLTAYHSGKSTNVPSYAKTVIDTTGAGDAFWAGFMASLLMKNNLHKALNHGSQIAAHKLEHVGAISDLPLPRDY